MLATAGSLGDLYPVLSIAKSLEDLGVEPRLLLSPDDCEVARSWGLAATPLGPTRAQICAELGRTQDELVTAFLRNPIPFLRRVAIPAMAAMIPQTLAACRGAGCVSGTFLAFGAGFAAEKAGLPYVPLALQPLLTYSALRPPRGPGFDLMARAPSNALTLGWNRALLSATKGVLRSSLHGPLNRLRAEMDLPPFEGTAMVDPGGGDVPMRLALWSEAFAPVPPDAPAGLRAVGFPRAPLGEMPAAARDWLERGPAPLVVSLGSIAQNLGGPAFYEEAVALGRAMGLRTVVLHGQAAAPAPAPDVLATPGLPHGALFPHAAVLLHHGGMGTMAEALRAGRPQLVLPIGGDQTDNASRLVDLGVAVTMAPDRFTAARALPLLQDLRARFDADAAGELARRITQEDGARVAARELARIAAGG